MGWCVSYGKSSEPKLTGCCVRTVASSSLRSLLFSTQNVYRPGGGASQNMLSTGVSVTLSSSPFADTSITPPQASLRVRSAGQGARCPPPGVVQCKSRSSVLSHISDAVSRPTCNETVGFRAFPMFVPSLSCKNDLYIDGAKRLFFLAHLCPRFAQSRAHLSCLCLLDHRRCYICTHYCGGSS
jgi:hypothetical protein|eukprot:COSAG06_NODE_2962_length_6022_cov_28.844816_7_plen_183_part_00